MKPARKGRFARRTSSAPLKPSCCGWHLHAAGKALSGWNQDRDLWVCPACGRAWVYLEDEADGGAWHWGKRPKCPKCGTGNQVWTNQVSGKLRCHRVGCEADLPPKDGR